MQRYRYERGIQSRSSQDLSVRNWCRRRHSRVLGGSARIFWIWPIGSGCRAKQFAEVQGEWGDPLSMGHGRISRSHCSWACWTGQLVWCTSLGKHPFISSNAYRAATTTDLFNLLSQLLDRRSTSSHHTLLQCVTPRFSLEWSRGVPLNRGVTFPTIARVSDTFSIFWHKFHSLFWLACSAYILLLWSHTMELHASRGNRQVLALDHPFSNLVELEHDSWKRQAIVMEGPLIGIAAVCYCEGPCSTEIIWSPSFMLRGLTESALLQSKWCQSTDLNSQWFAGNQWRSTNIPRCSTAIWHQHPHRHRKLSCLPHWCFAGGVQHGDESFQGLWQHSTSVSRLLQHMLTDDGIYLITRGVILLC